MADLTSRWSELYAGDYQHTLLDRKRVQLTELLASIDNEGDDELALLNYMATKGKEELQPITDALLSGLEADEKKVSAISREIQKEVLESLQQLHLALESQHQTLGAEHQKLNRKLTALDDEHRGLETEYRTLGEKHQALVTKNASLQDFERKFNALSLQQASLEGLVRTETDEANLREFELLKGEHQTLRDQHKNVEEENGKLKTQIRGFRAVEEENERLKTQLRGLGTVEEENERLKTQTRGLNDKLREEVENHDVLKNTNSRTNVAFRTAEEDIRILKKKYKDLEEIADDANSWKDKYNNAKRNLEDVAEKAQDWEKKHDKLSVELQASNSRAQE
jgi:chromosome segregation ATPase